MSIKLDQPNEVLITETDRARIRLAAGIDEASLAMVRESLQDGVQQVVNKKLNIAASSGLEKAATKCSTQLAEEVKSFFGSEKEEVQNLIAPEKAEIRPLFGSEKEKLKNLFASERRDFLNELRKMSDEFQSDVVAKAKEVHQSMSDEVGYLGVTKFDMLETY